MTRIVLLFLIIFAINENAYAQINDRGLICASINDEITKDYYNVLNFSKDKKIYIGILFTNGKTTRHRFWRKDTNIFQFTSRSAGYISNPKHIIIEWVIGEIYTINRKSLVYNYKSGSKSYNSQCVLYNKKNFLEMLDSIENNYQKEYNDLVKDNKI